MAAITISRQYGSGGRKIALRVSELLNWTLFDKQLMMQVASEVELTTTELVDFTEDDYRIKSFWEQLFSYKRPVVLAPTMYAMEYTTTIAQADEEWYVALTSATIQAAYKRGNVIIVGRGGQVPLQDKSDVLHVRIEAPLQIRIQHLETAERLPAGRLLSCLRSVTKPVRST